MTAYLIGGGVDTLPTTDLLQPFRWKVEHHADTRRRAPSLAVVLVDDNGTGERYLPDYVDALIQDEPYDIAPVLLRPHEPATPQDFADVDGIVVAGGRTPDYLDGLRPVTAEIRAAVLAGVPYLGFSAGAMVASRTALLGGYRHGGSQVCPQEWGEGLDEVTLHPGLGLVPFTVDVHTAQAGTLGRTVAAVAEGGAFVAVGIDEGTCLTVRHPDARPNECEVTGDGSVWWATSSATGQCTTVSLHAAEHH